MKFKDKTRGGYTYRIYATDGGGVNEIHGAVLVKGSSPGWWSCSWSAAGRSPLSDSYDLIPVEPIKGTVYVNCYERGCTAHPSRKEADYYAVADRVACKEVNWVGGEGLEKEIKLTPQENPLYELS